MADIPVQPPRSMSDEEAEYYDYLFENYESDFAQAQWQSALDWAKKGDFLPLAEHLRRADLPLNNQDVRNWLADGLVGGFKKPRKTAKAPEYVRFEMDGRCFDINKRYLTIFQAMKLVGETKASLGEDEAIRRAAKEFRMKAEDLRQHLRRPRSRWGLHPKSTDGMFDCVAKE